MLPCHGLPATHRQRLRYEAACRNPFCILCEPTLKPYCPDSKHDSLVAATSSFIFGCQPDTERLPCGFGCVTQGDGEAARALRAKWLHTDIRASGAPALPDIDGDQPSWNLPSAVAVQVHVVPFRFSSIPLPPSPHARHPRPRKIDTVTRKENGHRNAHTPPAHATMTYVCVGARMVTAVL